jgi:hypothetical protein
MASFEPPSTNCRPSPNMLQRYSAAQRAPPVGYTAIKLAVFAGKAQFLYLAIASAFLPTRTLLRVEYATWMGWPSPDDTQAKARPRMVADIARPEQRTLNLQTHRDGVPPRRFKRLRMGSRVKPQPLLPGARVMVRRPPTPTHHLEGATSRTTCNRIFPTIATGTQRLISRRQHCSRGYAFQAYHTLPRHDDRITEAMAFTRRQRHQHPP